MTALRYLQRPLRLGLAALTLHAASFVSAAAQAAGGVVVAPPTTAKDAGPTPPGAKDREIAFISHRAIYDITLDDARDGSGVADMTGRMVYELVGNACDGYTQNMRFVTEMTNRQGDQQLNDLRTSSWEGGEAKQLRFQSSQFLDKKLAEATQGDADRSAKGQQIAVKLVKPKARGLDIAGDTYFPIQHSLALMQAARDGKNRFAANLYDGSDTGDKVYETSAFIGDKVPASGTAKAVPEGTASPDADADAGGALVNTLDALPSWPIAISYFEPDADGTDAVPVYELSFRFFENGVSSNLRIDYGEFAIRGKLRELKVFEPAPCDKKS